MTGKSKYRSMCFNEQQRCYFGIHRTETLELIVNLTVTGKEEKDDFVGIN